MTLSIRINKDYQNLIYPLSKGKYDALKSDIQSNGITNPILVLPNGYVIDGHHRYKAWTELGNNPEDIPYKVILHLSSEPEIRNYIYNQNLIRRSPPVPWRIYFALQLESDKERSEDWSETHLSILGKLAGASWHTVFRMKKILYGDIKDISIAKKILGVKEDNKIDYIVDELVPEESRWSIKQGYDTVKRKQRAEGKIKSLRDRYIIPPFSILDTRQGYWQRRVDAWKLLGIGGEIGREDAKVFNTENNIAGDWTGTSIFDPVLCEITYHWYCPKNGSILDPFAGGPPRGIIANYLGYDYTGIELRESQVKANRLNVGVVESKHKEMTGEDILLLPQWYSYDSLKMDDILKDDRYDFIFSCPPYYDLEVYSQLPGELSAKPTYEEFKVSYSNIISKAVDRLKDDRFACFVVSDIRDKKNGMYRNFVSDTIEAFEDAGMHLYNESILVNKVGTLSMRVLNQFSNSRKIGKLHQNVLVFYKGNPSNIKNVIGTNDIDISKYRRFMETYTQALGVEEVDNIYQ